MAFQIRRMLPDDLDQVLEIDAHCANPPWSRTTFECESTSSSAVYLVAEWRARVLGYIGGQAIIDEAHISTLGVDPALRRRGVGQALLVGFLREAQRLGIRRVTLEVRESNAAAIALYLRHGFQPVSRRKRYYTRPDGDDEDALVLWIDDLTRSATTALLAERAAEVSPTRLSEQLTPE